MEAERDQQPADQQLVAANNENEEPIIVEDEIEHAQRWTDENEAYERWEENIAHILHTNLVPSMAEFVAMVKEEPIDLTTPSTTFDLQPLVPVLPSTQLQQRQSPSSTSSTISFIDRVEASTSTTDSGVVAVSSNINFENTLPIKAINDGATESATTQPLLCIDLNSPSSFMQELNAVQLNTAINANTDRIIELVQNLIHGMVYQGFLHRRLSVFTFSNPFGIFPPSRKVLEELTKTSITAAVCAIISQISPVNAAFIMRRLIGEPRYPPPPSPLPQQEGDDEDDEMLSSGEENGEEADDAESTSSLENEEDIPDELASFVWEAKMEEVRAQEFWRFTPLTIRSASDWDCSRNNICLICQFPFRPWQDIIEFPNCRHVFCAFELLRWLQAHTRCPHCREERPTKPPLIPINSSI